MRGQPYELGHQLREHNKYEDILDVFVNFLIKRSPTIFVLINMTLMIWLVQTIYSSRSDSIPRSIYYFSPFFDDLPVIGLEVGKNRSCSEGFQKTVLKTFPAIKQSHITRRNLTNWDIEPTTFCLLRSQTPKNFSLECPSPQHFCSGYCVSNLKQCPITSIRKIRIMDDIPSGTEFVYSTSDGLYKYVISRESKNDFVVGLGTAYEERCANDYRYFDKFQGFQEYWNGTKECGDEGRIPSEVYHPFDTMPVSKFLQNNQIWSPQIEKIANGDISLGTIHLIKFTNKTIDCTKAEILSKQLKNQLVEDAVKPTFTQSILIIAFVFFTVSWGWLVGYYCFEGSKKEKNMIVILMCIIELIVICFLYLQNLQMFRTEQLIVKIANCIETQLQATSHWTFGITNSSPFLSIIYCCTCFLLLQAVANFMDRRVYVNYYVEEGSGGGEGMQQGEGRGCWG